MNEFEAMSHNSGRYHGDFGSPIITGNAEQNLRNLAAYQRGKAIAQQEDSWNSQPTSNGSSAGSKNSSGDEINLEGIVGIIFFVVFGTGVYHGYVENTQHSIHNPFIPAIHAFTYGWNIISQWMPHLANDAGFWGTIGHYLICSAVFLLGLPFEIVGTLGAFLGNLAADIIHLF